MSHHVHSQPEVLCTCTYSVGVLLSESDGWSRVDLGNKIIAAVRRTLAGGEADLAIEMVTTALDRPILEVALVIKTGEIPDVFVREAT